MRVLDAFADAVLILLILLVLGWAIWLTDFVIRIRDVVCEILDHIKEEQVAKAEVKP